MRETAIETPRRQEVDVRGQAVVVLGLGTSGRAAADLLHAHGARVVAVEDHAQEATHTWAASALNTRIIPSARVTLTDIALLILSPGIPTTHPLVVQARAQAVPVWSEIELAYRMSQAPVVAITGSKGKSTTASLLGHLWQGAGHAGVVAGNIGLAYSSVVADLQADDWVILEVSSFQLETIDAFHPRVAVHLPVTPDHLDRYAGMEEYAAAKARIARHLTADDVLILDPRDPWSARLLEHTEARCVGIGQRGTAGAAPRCGVVQHEGQLVWRTPQGDEPLLAVDALPLVGRHNVHNAMAALAVLRSLDRWNPQAAQGLQHFEGLAYRMQPVGHIDGVRFLNDSKSTTVESVRAAVEGLDEPLILALGGRNKGLDFTPLRDTLGSVRRVLVFGEAAPELTTMLQGAASIETVSDLEHLVERALDVAEPGDTVLFSPGCTSFDMFENAEARGRAFTDVVDRVREARRS